MNLPISDNSPDGRIVRLQHLGVCRDLDLLLHGTYLHREILTQSLVYLKHQSFSCSDLEALILNRNVIDTGNQIHDNVVPGRSRQEGGTNAGIFISNRDLRSGNRCSRTVHHVSENTSSFVLCSDRQRYQKEEQQSKPNCRVAHDFFLLRLARQNRTFYTIEHYFPPGTFFELG